MIIKFLKNKSKSQLLARYSLLSLIIVINSIKEVFYFVE